MLATVMVVFVAGATAISQPYVLLDQEILSCVGCTENSIFTDDAEPEDAFYLRMFIYEWTKVCGHDCTHHSELYENLGEKVYGNQEVAAACAHVWVIIGQAANGCIRRCSRCLVAEVTNGHGIGHHRDVSATHHEAFCSRCGWVHGLLPHVFVWEFVNGMHRQRCTSVGCTRIILHPGIVSVEECSE